MSNYIDTREGWREVTADEWFAKDDDHGFMMTSDQHGDRYWVRETPVPQLPTAACTVIEVTWRDRPEGSVVFTRSPADGTDCWYQIYSEKTYDSRELSEAITGFQVLSEPRAVTERRVTTELMQDIGIDARRDRDAVRSSTARAVLDRVRQELDDGMRRAWLDTIAREFGVSQ